jgi:exopolysaccharide biosynthesis WecB/TagA/CpsF family protein
MLNQSAAAPNKTRFLDLDFTALDLDRAVDLISARASLEAPFEYVTTPNVDHLVALSREPARRALYEEAWLRLNDSKVLAALAKRGDLDLPVATGADIAESLLDHVIHKDEAVAIIGGDAEMIENLKCKYRLTDLRWHDAPRGLRANPAAIVEAARFAADQGARFTFICVGAPQQEMLAYAIKQQPGAIGVGLCVGAALAFCSGKKTRAPSWMRKAGLEWLHRLMSEPRRLWKRYLVDGPAIFSLFSAWRAEMSAVSAA